MLSTISIDEILDLRLLINDYGSIEVDRHTCEPRQHTWALTQMKILAQHGAPRPRAKIEVLDSERASIVFGEEPDEFLLDDDEDPEYVCGQCGSVVMMYREPGGDFVMYCSCREILRCS
jgi:hypothetical protein